MKTPDVVKVIKSRLRDNPECRLGIMARTRVAFAEKGVNSYLLDKELLVLISDRAWWYGYIRRLDPRKLKDQSNGEWIAILVQSATRIEGRTPRGVFRCLKRSWEENPRYHSYWIQEPEDGMALCDSFDEALEALNNIIDRFAVCLRECCGMGPDGAPLPPVGGKLDVRCMDLFGLCKLSDEEKFEKYEWPLIEAARKKAGLPPLPEEPQS